MTTRRAATLPHIPGQRTAPAVMRVGLLGCGVVGAPVARILLEDAEGVAAAAGVKLEIAGIAVRHPDKPRPVDLDAVTLTDDAWSLVEDPGVDVIVEVIGGVELPRALLLAALRRGKSVVTANKELLGACGGELALAAADGGGDLFFEASVGGAIPVVRALRDALVADEVLSVAGVVNGTTNFVLDRVAETGCTLDAAVEEAQRLGYAEADPSADLDGHDAAAKIAVLASLAFGGWIDAARVQRTGIRALTAVEIACARSCGYAVKLVASATKTGAFPRLRVEPALVATGSALGSLPGVLNAVRLECANAGPVVLSGRGAGGTASASAVVGDVVAAARNLRGCSRSPLPLRPLDAAPGAAGPAPERRRFLTAPVGAEDVVRAAANVAQVSIERARLAGSHCGFVTSAVTDAAACHLVEELTKSGCDTSSPLPIVEVE